MSIAHYRRTSELLYNRRAMSLTPVISARGNQPDFNRAAESSPIGEGRGATSSVALWKEPTELFAGRLSCIYMPDGADPTDKVNLSKHLNNTEKYIVLTKDELNDSGHKAVIPWVFTKRIGKWGKGTSAIERFQSADYVGIDYDVEGLDIEQVKFNVRKAFGEVECIISRSTNGRKWHILLRLDGTITGYEQYSAVRKYCAEQIGGDTGLKAFLIRCHSKPHYYEVSGKPFCWKHIQVESKDKPKRKAQKVSSPCPVVGRQELIKNVLDHCLRKEGLAGKVITRVSSNGTAAFSFPGQEKSPWSLYYQPDDDKNGTVLYHSDSCRFRGALYGRTLDKRVYRWLETKGIDPQAFNKAISNTRALLCPKNVVRCVKELLGANPDIQPLFKLVIQLLSVRTRFIRSNVKKLLAAFSFPAWICALLNTAIAVSIDAVLSCLKGVMHKLRDLEAAYCKDEISSVETQAERERKDKRNAKARMVRRAKNTANKLMRWQQWKSRMRIQQITQPVMAELGNGFAYTA